jgi:antitoxin component of MazEF toxin-antitoxin module
MLKRIQQIGNSQGVIIDKTVLRLVGAEDATALDLTVENGAIVLRPIDETGRKARIEAAGKTVLDKYAPALRKLSK